MPLFVMYGLDGPGGADIRKETRPAHLAWIASLAPRVKVGGPLLADDGAAAVGSMIVLEAADLTEAKAVLGEDPYQAARLWERIEIRPFNWVAP